MARYALVIGIAEYDSRYLNNLSKPGGDAEAVAALLHQHGMCEQVTVLKGRVTTQAVGAAFKKLLTQQATKNEVIVYFTGHGITVTDVFGGSQGFLTTSDCEISVEQGRPVGQKNAIAFNSLNALVQQSDLSNLVMLLDVCHGGDLIERELVERDFSAFNTQQDYYLITACRGFEQSWAKRSEAHSVFTGALLAGLMPDKTDNEGCITGDRLFDHLRGALRGTRQEPVRFGRGRSIPIVRFQQGRSSGFMPRSLSVSGSDFTEPLGIHSELEMVRIPGDRFWMGSPDNEPERYDDEGPLHAVEVAPFWMGKYPITQQQWTWVAALPAIKIDLKPYPSYFKGEKLPVERVSWHEAVEFCQRLSQATGRIYRLPSEAEWEYACRAGTITPFHFGETITPDMANYDGDFTYGAGPKGRYRGETTAVGSFSANKFGLYDLHGNVWEWCQDVWHENYDGAPQDGTAWMAGGNQDRRVRRGGSWDYNPRNCRSAYRSYSTPGDRNNAIGFRVVCVAAP